MLTKFKKHMLMLQYDYHYRAENYYLGKINEKETKYNAYRWDKVRHHANKEYKLVEKLVKLEET